MATGAPGATAGRNGDGDGGAPAPPERERPADPAARSAPSGLDTLLTEAARGPVRSWFPGMSGAKLVAKLAIRPDITVRRSVSLATELTKVAVGRSDVAPPKGDRRFADPAWTGNPALRRLMQAYLATGRTVDATVCDAGLDWRAERRVRFAVDNVIDALAPSNFPATNPAAVKAAIDTGGMNFVRGTRNLVRDMSSAPRVPSMVDADAFTVGEDLAITPGSVVLRTPVFELLQYDPATPEVREVPLVVTPPMINKFYITDLAPDRSMIEFLVSQGQQVFAISWRNPDERHADWGLDRYAGAVIDALDAVAEITGAEQAHVLGLCAGGITASCALAHLAATDRLDRVAGLTLGVTVIDNERSGMAGAMVDPGVAAAAMSDSARRGYLDGRSLAGVFAWLRPNDLVWNYWVNNYLLGKHPPAFDILYWNSDTTNLPAALHRDFLNVALHNALVYPGEVEVLGTPVDLGRITVDAYLVAGIADHITPWENAYRTVRLLGGTSRFVLSTSGHIAALVNPPGNPKARYQTNDALPDDPDAFLAGAQTSQGTWWTDWGAWLGERSGGQRPAPQAPGSERHPPLGRAPGTYVLQ
jgi:polyhydroxyalkanoate synthase